MMLENLFVRRVGLKCGAELGFAPEEHKFIQSSFAQSCQIALKEN